MAGLNLLDMIMQAQGGQAPQNVGAQFGLDQTQSQNAIAALLPAISSALRQNTASPQGLQGLLGALQGGQHDQYLDNADALRRPETVQDGNAILGHLFGSKDVSRAVAGRAAEKSGVGADVLKKMLPLVATMAMGSLSKQTKEPSIASQLSGLMGGLGAQPQQRQSGGMLGSILGAALGGNARRQRQVQQQQVQAQQQGMGLLGKLLDADGDGNTMDDILGMAMKSMTNRR